MHKSKVAEKVIATKESTKEKSIDKETKDKETKETGSTEKLGKLPPLKKKEITSLDNLPPLKGIGTDSKGDSNDMDTFSSNTEKKHLKEADTLIKSQNKATVSPVNDKYDDDFEIDEEIMADYLEDSQEQDKSSKSPLTDDKQGIEQSGTLTASMGIDQSVDSLILEDFDYLEPVEKPGTKKK